MMAYAGRHRWIRPYQMPVRQRAVQLLHVDPAVLEPLFGQGLLGDHDPDVLLAQITCPVHLIAAESGSGGVMTLDDVQRVAAQVPHAAHTIVTGTGHDIHLDRPQLFFRAVVSFL